MLFHGKKASFLGRVVDAHRIVIGLPSKWKSKDDGGVVYEPGPYEVLTYEDIVFGSGLAHTAVEH